MASTTGKELNGDVDVNVNASTEHKAVNNNDGLQRLLLLLTIAVADNIMM